MSEPPNDPYTQALRDAGRRRADLHRALVDVEEAISGPAVGRIESWIADVAKHLHGLLATMDEHIEGTERVGGLYDEIQSRAPRLARQIKALHEEHPVLRERTHQLAERLETRGVDDDWPADAARDDVQRLLGEIVRHRQHGADLVYEAYQVDIGGLES
jgi:hypothetical protein